MTDEIEKLAKGIAEVSSHARNILLTQASLAVFLLLAAAGDREATLGREKAEQEHDEQARKLRTASVLEAEKEGELGRIRSELRAQATKLEQLETQRDADEKVLQDAEAKFRLETRRQLGGPGHGEPFVDDAETEERRLASVRQRVDKLRESPLYAIALKGPRLRQERAKRRLDDLVENEQVLAEIDANPRAQPSPERLDVAVRLWALRAANGVIDGQKVADELSRARNKLPGARAEWVSAKRAFERAVAAHPKLWREVQAAELEAKMVSARVARFDGTQQGLPPVRIDGDSPVERLFSGFQNAMQKADETAQKARTSKAEVTRITELVRKAERGLEESKGARAGEVARANESGAKLERAKKLEAESSLKLPLVDIAIKPRDFFRIAPFLLFLVFLYLRVYVRELVRRLDWLDRECDAASWTAEARERALHPWLINFSRYRWGTARLLGPFSVDWLAPLAQLALCWTYAQTLHPDGAYVAYMLIVALVSFSLSLAAANREGSWTSLPLVRISNAHAVHRRPVLRQLKTRVRWWLRRRRRVFGAGRI